MLRTAYHWKRLRDAIALYFYFTGCLKLVGSSELLMHRRLHAPDLSRLLQNLAHKTFGLHQVSYPKAAIQVLANNIPQRVPSFTASYGHRKHSSPTFSVNMIAPGTHVHYRFFRRPFSLRILIPRFYPSLGDCRTMKPRCPDECTQPK